MKKEILLTDKYLRLPVIRDGEDCEVSFSVNGEKIWQFTIPVKTEGKRLLHRRICTTPRGKMERSDDDYRNRRGTAAGRNSAVG